MHLLIVILIKYKSKTIHSAFKDLNCFEMEELFSVMQLMLKKVEEAPWKVIYERLFCFLDLKVHVTGCFPVSAFSVFGKADDAAEGAVTLICSRGWVWGEESF